MLTVLAPAAAVDVQLGAGAVLGRDDVVAGAVVVGGGGPEGSTWAPVFAPKLSRPSSLM